MDKILPVQKEVSSTNNFLRERKKLYHGAFAGTVFQLSSRSPRLLSQFPTATEFFFLPSFHMWRYSVSGYRPVWLFSKAYFFPCSSKTRSAPVTVPRACCCCWPDRRNFVDWILVIPCKRFNGFKVNWVHCFVCVYRWVHWRGNYIVCACVCVFLCVCEKIFLIFSRFIL